MKPSNIIGFKIIDPFGVTSNNPPERPTATSPADESYFDEIDAITLKAGVFSDSDGDDHAQTKWQVLRADNRDLVYEEISTTDLTQHTIPAGSLDPGLKYVWRARYEDSNGNLSSWSSELSFKVGTSETESLPAVESGVAMTDFGMISFVHWPNDPNATSVINVTYDSKYYRIGTYDPTMGGYIEYGNGLMIEPGKAYWILAREGLRVNYSGIPVSLLVDIDVSLSYKASTGNGWNMIACPNAANYLWDHVKVVYDHTEYDMSDPTVDTLIDRKLWKWDNGSYLSYSPGDNFLMEKYSGYWVKAKQANVYLRFPVSAQADLSNTKVMLASFLDKVKKWVLSTATATADSGGSPPMPMGALSSDAKGGGGGSCFIATAAYGSAMAPQVNVLREFRDRFLLTSSIGKTFVDCYYKYSPPLADFIEKHHRLKTAVRIILLPVVGLSWIAVRNGFAFTMVLMLVFGTGIAGFIRYRKKSER